MPEIDFGCLLLVPLSTANQGMMFRIRCGQPQKGSPNAAQKAQNLSLRRYSSSAVSVSLTEKDVANDKGTATLQSLSCQVAM